MLISYKNNFDMYMASQHREYCPHKKNGTRLNSRDMR